MHLHRMPLQAVAPFPGRHAIDFAALASSLHARAGVDEDDDLQPHDLDAEACAALVRHLQGVPAIAAAWLVRKRLALPGEPPHYVLLVHWRGSLVAETAGLKRLASALALPGSVTVLGDGDSTQRVYSRRLREIAAEVLYRRD